MSENALRAQGVVLQRGDGASTEVFTAVAEVTGWSGFDGEASEIDVTDLSSTKKELLLGLMDHGSFTFDGFLLPGDTPQDGLRSDRDSKAKSNFKLILTDDGSTEIPFSAYVKRFSLTGQGDGAITFNCSLRITDVGAWV